MRELFKQTYHREIHFFARPASKQHRTRLQRSAMARLATRIVPRHAAAGYEASNLYHVPWA